MNKKSLIENFEKAGQGHVFAFFEQLSSDEQASLLAEAAEVDLNEIEILTRTLLRTEAKGGMSFEGLVPADYKRLPENGGDFHEWAVARSAGEAALRCGRVAAFTVAGGQGTRLGYDGPKGTFAVTPIEQKSLFQVFAEKLLAVGRRYGKSPLWFIMTSSINHEATETFFREHRFFGLDQARVHLFRQGRMPAVNFEGKIMMASRGTVAMSPDGHGGSFRALARSGALDLMQREGVDILSYFQVDNPLVRVIDPAFIGWHVLAGSEMSSKMVPKAYAGEKVGHFCTQDGRSVVIEYSDLPLPMQEEIDSKTGLLRYLAGSIAIHILDTKFIRRMAAGEDGSVLPFHRADKKIPTIDVSGNAVSPTKPNGVKFELFIFDALPFAQKPVIIETRREDEFSPVKNAEGIDSPKTCKDDQVRQFARWLNKEGASIPTDKSGLSAHRIEVSPLFGYDAESFSEAWLRRSEDWRRQFFQLVKTKDVYLAEKDTSPPIKSMKAEVVALFEKIYGYTPTIVTRAPGRIEFIGNHTDYNGGTVLGAAIDRGVWVAMAANQGTTRRFYSDHSNEIVTLPCDTYERQHGRCSWVNYPLGVLSSMRVFHCEPPNSFDYAVISNLPSGAGLSSSAAIELASALAFLQVSHQQVDRKTLIEIGKYAENHFVGVPCGILDQGVSGYGQRGRLVFIDCRGPHFDTVPIPSGARFWIFNTHTKHALVDGMYSERNRQCMDAARALGVVLLADVSAADLCRMQASLNADSFKRAKHVVDEIDRVSQTIEALRNDNLAAVGRLLTASHHSSKTLFENSTPELDFLVDELVATKNVYGARLTGGGFGGAVMALTHADFDEADAQKIVEAYAAKFGHVPDVIQTQTDDGAACL